MFDSKGLLAVAGISGVLLSCGHDSNRIGAEDFLADASLQLTGAALSYRPDLDAVVFEVSTGGDAASVVPPLAGGVDGAPVLGYVFMTDLQPRDVGFGQVEGTVALAVTSHPDFDDTPLWDEDANERFDDDGAVYHAHWVVLGPDQRAPAGLAVVQSTATSTLPPTAPMAMYLDSPGFSVRESGRQLRVLVPADRMRRRFAVSAEALVAYMKVDASGAQPLLGVHRVVSTLEDAIVLSGASNASASAWPTAVNRLPDGTESSMDVEAAQARYVRELDTFVLTMDVAGAVASIHPPMVGQVDGAPVVGYVFPTSIPPAAVGFIDRSGTLVLAVTSHPDFDDTPLWDESLDQDYGNDGGIYHVHWAVLVEDSNSPAGLSVPSQADMSMLPPTAPMAMALDSPGFHAFATGSTLTVLLPAWHLRGVRDFSFDALTALMRVDASGPGPVLRVVSVFDILSGDLSLPLRATRE